MPWLLLTAVLIFIADRLTKTAAIATLTLNGSVVYWPNVLEWRLTHNQGMALGLFAGNWLVTILLPLAIVLFSVRLLRRYRITVYTGVAIGLLVGGFVGNMIDRLVLGYVPDMIYFPWMPWYICNVADIAITFGVVLLGFSLLCRPKDWVAKNKEGEHEAHPLDSNL